MTDIVRPEVSKKRPYYIPRYRYYELRYFCLQYKDWQRMLSSVIHMPSSHYTEVKSDAKSDMVLDAVILRDYYKRRIDLVWEAAKRTEDWLAAYILEGVTTGCGYTYLKTVMNIPCGKDLYYENYHKFFWILDKLLIKTESTT